MKQAFAAAALLSCVFSALPASAQSQAPKTPPAKLYDLSGEWSATYHDPGGIDVEKVMIANFGADLVATKETGDPYVPAGKITFRGRYTANPFAAQQQHAFSGFTNPSWWDVTITVIDQDHFTLRYPGTTENWQRIGKPTLALDSAILFDLNRHDLRPVAAATLDQVIGWLADKHPASHLLVAGYTDDTGGEALNLELSRQQAETVAAALHARGVAASRLATRGFGKANPRYPNSNDDARAHNRRVEIVIQD